MSNILNLDINLKTDVDTTINSISNKLTNSWSRDIKAENSVQEMGSTQYAFNYKSAKQNNTIFLIERDNKLQTTNIVPQDGVSSIPIIECNNMLKKFEEDVLGKTSLVYSIHNS